ncbi:putative serine dehydratase domain-containing protein [Durotheca rogersii]|uniref:putative serine dehydratase domain-containing protein n=1 Tax=Durotheca rogersii TaxID=419775 RepID=UPI00221F4947|nr:putative serine dehydratase domain-containing protein [Durotheca rogersii]KAI5865907.1 putative serine dehydratase domain-containing protein [Durotheca rogersii]
MAVQFSKDSLRAQFVGKSLYEVPTPAAVLDLAKVEENCNMMIEAARRLQLSWRAHVKTHKTEELTRLQVRDASPSPVNLIVSTIVEAEKVVPLLKEYQEKGRQVNVLYSFPLYGSCVDRLGHVSAKLGPDALVVMVDHAEQVPHLASLAAKSGGHVPLVFLKVDVGSHRAGVIPGTSDCDSAIDALLRAEAAGSCRLLGLYSHAGHSYATRRDWEAMGILNAEFETLRKVAVLVRDKRTGNHPPLVLSVGATPTVTTIQHPDLAKTADTETRRNGDDATTAATESGGKTSGADGTDGSVLLTVVPTAHLKSLIQSLKAEGFVLEVHAGVYPTLDVQQLAAHARDYAHLNSSMIGITVLADVASVYRGRGGDGGADEALVNAGCIALGREPCQDMGEVKGQDYGGWGIVAPWGDEALALAHAAAPSPLLPGPRFPAAHGGWQVARLSQEHGILRWQGRRADAVPLRVGQRVRIWPNHACIAGAAFPYYLVVDSRRGAGREDEIVDVWVRWNGW